MESAGVRAERCSWRSSSVGHPSSMLSRKARGETISRSSKFRLRRSLIAGDEYGLGTLAKRDEGRSMPRSGRWRRRPLEWASAVSTGGSRRARSRRVRALPRT